MSASDIPDFLIESRVVVEVKIKGQRNAIELQLIRYSLHPTVSAIVLATGPSVDLRV